MISSADAQAWIDKPPCYVIPDTAADEELGAAVVAAAEAVWLDAPHASDEIRAAWEREILDTVGVKDRATFERNARLAGAGLDADGWELKRYKRFRGGGWGSDEGHVVRLGSDATAGSLGHALKELLSTPTMHID